MQSACLKYLKFEGARTGKRQDPMANIKNLRAIVHTWNMIQDYWTTNLKTGTSYNLTLYTKIGTNSATTPT